MKNYKITVLIFCLFSTLGITNAQVAGSLRSEYRLSFLNPGVQNSWLVLAPPADLSGQYSLTLPIPPLENGYLLKIDKQGVITPYRMDYFAPMAEYEQQKKENVILKEQVQQLEIRLAQLETAVQAAVTGRNRTAQRGGDFPMISRNEPNPFSESTIISYYIPETVNKAEIIIDGATDGKQMMKIPVSAKGFNSITIFGKDLASGTYVFYLVADGQVYGTQQFVVVK
jgi:hypothetical protein